MKKNLCKECPFKIDSLAGYLGDASYQPELFLATIEDQPIPCHMAIDWEKEDGLDKNYSNPCIGSLKYLKNTMKLPRDRQYSNLRNLIKETDPTIFKRKLDFINHHKEK